MKYVRVHQIADGVDPLRDRIMRDLSDGLHVLWLVSGGSNIPLTVAVMAQLPDEMTSNLTILLTDERYGDVGHANSNAHQLDETGFIPKLATVIPVLREGLSMDETVREYSDNFQKYQSGSDVIIGQFGMGDDGHIAGLLPQSPAIGSADLAAGYTTEQYNRITLTPKALLQVTTAYLFAFGAEKLPALETLRSRSVSIDEQPAQLLKQIPDAYIYNDQMGD